MLHDFLIANRSELVDRCRLKVAARRAPRATPAELEHGIPLFLDQLTGMLPAAGPAVGAPHASSGPVAESQMERSATRHGRELLRNDFSIDQVVHDYGDLCQSIMEVASEQGSSISVEDFAILNIRLDNAIADAVTEYARQGEDGRADATRLSIHHRVSGLAAEMRNLLNTTIVAISAIKGGGVGFRGATATALDRSLIGMRSVIDRLLAQVRLESSVVSLVESVEVASFIADIRVAASLEAGVAGCDLVVNPVDADVFMSVDPQLLSSAVSVLLQEAFRSTGHEGVVMLSARSAQRRVLIEVQDANHSAEPGERRAHGAAFALIREGIEASGGQLFTRDMEGGGCVATIALPRTSPLAFS
jgi:signal transduction histidine kinase